MLAKHCNLHKVEYICSYYFCNINEYSFDQALSNIINVHRLLALSPDGPVGWWYSNYISLYKVLLSYKFHCSFTTNQKVMKPSNDNKKRLSKLRTVNCIRGIFFLYLWITKVKKKQLKVVFYQASFDSSHNILFLMQCFVWWNLFRLWELLEGIHYYKIAVGTFSVVCRFTYGHFCNIYGRIIFWPLSRKTLMKRHILSNR